VEEEDKKKKIKMSKLSLLLYFEEKKSLI